MSDTYGRAKFDQILSDVRSDLEYIKKLYAILVSRVEEGSRIDSETQHWIMDVFIDKLYELVTRVDKICLDINKERAGNTNSSSSTLISRLHYLAFPERQENLSVGWESMIEDEINKLIKWVEWDLSNLRQKLIKEDWTQMSAIKPVTYIAHERKKYVTAREELMKARQNLEEHPEDVMNYIRTSIDLALKEKFGFSKIPKMIKFIEEADKLGFPLPSYDLIYSYFWEGSQRLHQGKIHTQFEAQEVLRTVANFIDDLELISIEKNQLDDFVSKCKCVEI